MCCIDELTDIEDKIHYITSKSDLDAIKEEHKDQKDALHDLYTMAKAATKRLDFQVKQSETYN